MKGIGFFVFFSLYSILCTPAEKTHPSFYKKWDFDSTWIVSPLQALRLQKDSNAKMFVTGFVFTTSNDFTQINWKDFSETNSAKAGNLLPNSTLYSLLDKRKILPSETILILGDPQNGWGEEGRIVWMLRCLGYEKSYFVDGGYKAFQIAKKNLEKFPVEDALKENKTQTTKNKDFSINSESLKDKIFKHSTIVIDTREKREFLGETPYGETRGGHIPGAIWFYFKEFLDKDGFILNERLIQKKLQSKGITKNKEIISYCTGGVRSAWLTSLLQSMGYNAKNYAGSMWEWSSLDPQNGFILIKGEK